MFIGASATTEWPIKHKTPPAPVDVRVARTIAAAVCGGRPRPLSFNESQHFVEPTINCPTAAADTLAQTVCGYLPRRPAGGEGDRRRRWWARRSRYDEWMIEHARMKQTRITTACVPPSQPPSVAEGGVKRLERTVLNWRWWAVLQVLLLPAFAAARPNSMVAEATSDARARIGQALMRWSRSE